MPLSLDVIKLQCDPLPVSTPRVFLISNMSDQSGRDKVFKLLIRIKNIILVLHKLSAAADTFGLLGPYVKTINTCLAVLRSVSTVKDIIDKYDTLVDFLDAIEHFLKHLNIYTKIPPTVPITEMNAKKLIELLSALTLMTKRIKKRKANVRFNFPFQSFDF